jgi:aspartyl-tRNA(Asn)/glutamyl-tRNA(Gln) amidotransferase subunit C
MKGGRGRAHKRGTVAIAGTFGKARCMIWCSFFPSQEPIRMSLTRAQVEGIAHLARLQITEAQMPVYVDSLSRIIDFVEQLAAADTGGVEPMAHPLADQVQRLRPDAVTETDAHEKYQQNAASVAAGLYLVPKVIE